MKSWLQNAFSNATPQVNKQANAASEPNVKSNVGQTVSGLVALQLASRAHWSSRDFTGLSKTGFQQNAICYRCVRLISEAAASVSFLVNNDDNNPDFTAAQNLLNKPSPKMSRAEFFEQFYGYLQLSGNAYVEAVLVDTMPKALFALRPDRVQARIGRDGWPSAWEYTIGGKKQIYAIDPIEGVSLLHHMRLFHPNNDIYGFSPLEAAGQALDVHNAGGVWTKALLDNSARPSGALVYQSKNGQDRLSDEQFNRLKSELENNHSGAMAAGRPLLLEGGLDWKTMSMSPTDMDFINARREAAREIALAFGVPPMLLGIPGDNTYSNYKEANLAFWRQTIMPLVQKTAQSYAVWLSAWFGDDLTVQADLETVPALSNAKMAQWSTLDEINFLTQDEKRNLAGYAPSTQIPMGDPAT